MRASRQQVFATRAVGGEVELAKHVARQDRQAVRFVIISLHMEHAPLRRQIFTYISSDTEQAIL
jgi:hypothetical protein